MRATRGLVLFAALCANSFAAAIITNGSGVYLGVDNLGQLNVPNGTGGVTLPIHAGQTAYIGLYSTRTSGDSTSPGCLCEGWGVAADGSLLAGANNAVGNFGTLVSFASTASTATSIVSGGGLTITHQYQPSASSSLYEGIVTITNDSGSDVSDLLYRRLMDWDVMPTPYNEFTTIQGWPATALLHTSNNGFQSYNPLSSFSGIYGCPENANFSDCGPFDHGSLFDFGFGGLADGATKTFSIFYGWTDTERAALAALGTVGAEVYSLGQTFDDPSGTGTGPDAGDLAGTNRATFIFGFKGVGGVPLPDPVPEPGTYVMLTAGLASFIGLRRWRNA